MAHIVINNYCNLRCPDCFAEGITAEPPESMELSEVGRVLDFLSRSRPFREQVGIVGGEPTLHPRFREVLALVGRFARANGSPTLLLTNGVELARHVEALPNGMAVLVNVNSPDDTGDEAFLKTLSSVSALAKRGSGEFTLGCNLYPGRSDYGYIWDVLSHYGCQNVRMSVVSPFGCGACERGDKESYFEKMKPVFVRFCEDAIRHGVAVKRDCSQIPPCYFSPEELEVLGAATTSGELGPIYCSSMADFRVGGLVSTCYGWGAKPVPYEKFRDVAEVYAYFDRRVQPQVVERNIENERCASCEHAALGRCCGGCPAFAPPAKQKGSA